MDNPIFFRICADFDDLQFETRWTNRTLHIQDGTEEKVPWEQRLAVIFGGSEDELLGKPQSAYPEKHPIEFASNLLPAGVQGRGKRQTDVKRAALVRSGFHPNRAAHIFSGFPDDSQSHADAFILAFCVQSPALDLPVISLFFPAGCLPGLHIEN